MHEIDLNEIKLREFLDNFLSIRQIPMLLNAQGLMLAKLNTLIDMHKRYIPVDGDEPVFRSESASISANKEKTFIFEIPKPRTVSWFIEKIGFSFFEDATFEVMADGQQLITDKSSFDPQGDPIILRPPKIVSKEIRVKIKNDSSSARIFFVTCSGFSRRK